MKSFHAKILVGLIFIAGHINAQESLSTTTSTSTSTISSASDTNPVNGFQIGIRKGFAEKAKIKARAGGATFSDSSSDFTHQFGFGLGWAQHNFQSIGFKGGLNYDNFDSDENGESFSAMNLEANATVMVNQHFIPYGGINLNKYVSGDTLEDMDPAIGYQIGFTGQMVERLSYQAAWQSINNTDTVDGAEVDVSISSFQVGLIYTL